MLVHTLEEGSESISFGLTVVPAMMDGLHYQSKQIISIQHKVMFAHQEDHLKQGSTLVPCPPSSGNFN